MRNIIKKVYRPFKEKFLSGNNQPVNRVKEYVNAEQIKSCLIVWKANESERNWLEKIKKSIPVKKMDMICILPDNYVGERIYDVTYIHPDDVDIKGNFNDEKINLMLNKQYDLLIDLNQTNEIFYDFIIRQSHAKCKIGFLKEGNDWDIMIDDSLNISDFINNISLILNKFKKH